MKYFSQDYPAFFKELESNNHKEWFDQNRKRYEQVIKEPFKLFIKNLMEEMQVVYPNTDLAENTSIMRINRDIRFSKDKTPYKIHMAAMIMPHGKKDYSKPGMFLQANHVDVRVYSGIHDMGKESLHKLRNQITNNLNEFDQLINAKEFKSLFGEIRGEKNKRIDKEFQEAGMQQPLLFNKSFYYFFKLDPKVLLQEDLISQLVDGYKKALPLNEFFEKALA